MVMLCLQHKSNKFCQLSEVASKHQCLDMISVRYLEVDLNSKCSATYFYVLAFNLPELSFCLLLSIYGNVMLTAQERKQQLLSTKSSQQTESTHL